jgi:hypothetical protein
MAGPLLFDRVKETTGTTGTGPLALAGAAQGFRPFSVVGDGNTCYYCVAEQLGGAWEVGVGTYAAAGNTLARTTVLASSNGGAAVDLPAGTKDAFLDWPAAAAAAVARTDQGNTFAGAQLLQSGAVGTVPLTAQGAANQSANLQEWRDSTGAVLLSVSAAGTLAATRTSGGSGLLSLTSWNAVAATFVANSTNAVKADVASGVTAAILGGSASSTGVTGVQGQSGVGIGVYGLATQSAGIGLKGGVGHAAGVPVVAQGVVVSATVTNKALTSNVATLTTSANHGFTNGTWVTVAGVDATFNGTYLITSVASTTFSYGRTAADVAGQAATGTAAGTNQTANLQEWRDGSGTAVAKLSPVGDLTLSVVGSGNYIFLNPNNASGRPEIRMWANGVQDLRITADGGGLNLNGGIVATAGASSFGAVTATPKLTVQDATDPFLRIWKTGNAWFDWDLGTNNALTLKDTNGSSVGAFADALNSANVRMWLAGRGGVATVTNKALTANVATLTTSAAHGFAANTYVVVAGVDATFNGTFLITSVASTTFTYAKTAANVASQASAGTATANIQTGNLQEWRDGSGVALAYVPPAGGMVWGANPNATSNFAYRFSLALDANNTPTFTAPGNNGSGANRVNFQANTLSFSNACSAAGTTGTAGIGFYLSGVGTAGLGWSGTGNEVTLYNSAGAMLLSCSTTTVVTTAGASAVPLVAKAGNASANIQEWQSTTGTALTKVDAKGGIVPASMADASAANGTLYFSTTANKLVYKDAGGVVNALY